MTNYFGNLISRHAPTDSNAASLAVVTPRPKYKFEGESTSATSMQSELANVVARDNVIPNSETTEHASNFRMQTKASLNESQTDVTSVTSLVVPEFVVPRSDKTKITNSESNAKNNVNTVARTLNESTLNKQGAFSLSEKTQQTKNGFDDLSNKQSSFSAVDLHAQVASILQGLNGSSVNPKLASETNFLSPKIELTRPEASSQNFFDGFSQSESDNSSFDIKQSAESLPPVIEQTNKQDKTLNGVLNTPSWLSEIQASLNTQMQKLNQHVATPEPVINVTIGRVEVRAVQANSTKTQNSQKKPNGVMSLDEYLQQRKSRGRS